MKHSYNWVQFITAPTAQEKQMKRCWLFWNRPTLKFDTWLSWIIYKIKYLSLFKVQRSSFSINLTVTKNGCVDFRRHYFWEILSSLIFFIRARYFYLIINFNLTQLIFNIFIFLLYFPLDKNSLMGWFVSTSLSINFSGCKLFSIGFVFNWYPLMNNA